jgi:hypothetical protein
MIQEKIVYKVIYHSPVGYTNLKLHIAATSYSEAEQIFREQYGETAKIIAITSEGSIYYRL